MISVNVEKAARTLPGLIHHTLMNCEETVIVSENGAVVMIDQAEWENMKETLNLLRDRKSLKALLDGHRQRDLGRIPDSVTVENAFYDL